MQMLKASLYLLKQQENAEKLSDIRGDVKDINFGNQIRSYVMQPYTLVKDHRTNAENGNVNAVMDGDIDLFISAYLKWISLKARRLKNSKPVTAEREDRHQSGFPKLFKVLLMSLIQPEPAAAILR